VIELKWRYNHNLFPRALTLYCLVLRREWERDYVYAPCKFDHESWIRGGTILCPFTIQFRIRDEILCERGTQYLSTLRIHDSHDLDPRPSTRHEKERATRRLITRSLSLCLRAGNWDQGSSNSNWMTTTWPRLNNRVHWELSLQTRVLVYTVNSRGHVVPLESPSRVYPSISMTGEP